MQTEAEIIARRKAHPEHVTMLQFTLRRWWDGLMHPKIRLSLAFPWGLKEFSKLYAVAAVYYVVGSIVPLFLIFGACMIALQVAPHLVLDTVATPDGHATMPVILTATVISFMCGFGAELMFFTRELHKKGISLREAIGLNLHSLHGSWGEALKRAVISLAIAIALQNLLDFVPVPKPHQMTADMAANATGVSMVAFVFLAAICAPFFEEIIFRGCVFNAFRNIFREGRIFRWLKENPARADYCAVAMSAFLFAAAHLDASAFFQLFILGVVLAESYRRSGSLLVPMMIHAFNNVIATVIIAIK